jgi:hypothetical protein
MPSRFSNVLGRQADRRQLLEEKRMADRGRSGFGALVQ